MRLFCETSAPQCECKRRFLYFSADEIHENGGDQGSAGRSKFSGTAWKTHAWTESAIEIAKWQTSKLLQTTIQPTRHGLKNFLPGPDHIHDLMRTPPTQSYRFTKICSTIVCSPAVTQLTKPIKSYPHDVRVAVHQKRQLRHRWQKNSWPSHKNRIKSSLSWIKHLIHPSMDIRHFDSFDSGYTHYSRCEWVPNVLPLSRSQNGGCPYLGVTDALTDPTSQGVVSGVFLTVPSK